MTPVLEAWREATNARIHDTLQRSARTAAIAGPHLTEITDPMLDAAAGGKRLRALVLLASHAAHTEDTHDQPPTSLAAAVELFQTAALIHDDVLDASDTRRGMPAAHRRVAAVHHAHGWVGDSDAYGAAGGVLAGDLTLMACQRALTDALLVLPSDRAARAGAMFADMTDLVTAGQYADMRAAALPADSIAEQHDDILAVMRSKTASYTCEYPLALGAVVAGADAAAVETMRAIGVDLGVAFQLRDDLLGLTGAPEVTGKPAGDDVREGKRTWVLWRAWTSTDDAGRAHIRTALGDRHAPDASVERVIDVVAATDAVDWCEREISRRADRSRAALAGAGMDATRSSTLVALIDALVTRDA